jgi:putative polymerase
MARQLLLHWIDVFHHFLPVSDAEQGSVAMQTRLAVGEERDSIRVGLTTLVGATLLAAIVFNPVLAFINAGIMGIGRNHVAAAEMLVVAFALMLIAFNARRIMLPWIGLLAGMAGAGIFFGLVNYEMELRYIRDIVNIPIFVLLGMLFVRGDIVRLIIFVQLLVLTVLLFEGLLPREFGTTFDIISYYVNTRGFSEELFWNPDSTLFVSATRPGERFMLSFLEIHRLSSLFLEPVSLGNYTVIMIIFIVAFWRRMSFLQKAFLVGSTLIILVGSDGRLALVIGVIIIAGSFVYTRLPAFSHIIYLPAAVLAAALIVSLLGIRSGADDFPGRVAFSMDMLATLDLSAMMGLSQYTSVRYDDSGIAYFIVTQSILGVTAIWLFICLIFSQKTRTNIIFIHGIAIYISLNLLVSYSLFSIKTASLLWFIYGYLHAEEVEAGSEQDGRALTQQAVQPQAAFGRIR